MLPSLFVAHPSHIVVSFMSFFFIALTGLYPQHHCSTIQVSLLRTISGLFKSILCQFCVFVNVTLVEALESYCTVLLGMEAASALPAVSSLLDTGLSGRVAPMLHWLRLSGAIYITSCIESCVHSDHRHHAIVTGTSSSVGIRLHIMIRT